METCQLSQNRVVEYAAKKAASIEGVADKRGRDRDDYRQLLLMKAWLAGQSAPDHGKDARQRWEFVAVRNQLRSYKKELKRHPDILRYDLLAEDERHAPSFERHMERRQVIEKLQQYLEPIEAKILVTYAAHGCSSVSVWEAFGRPFSYRYFCRILREIRIKCFYFIMQICPEMVPKNCRLAL